MRVHELPYWPPPWIMAGTGPVPHSNNGIVLQHVLWRDDGQTRYIHLEGTFHGNRVMAIYPGTDEIWTRLREIAPDVEGLVAALYALLDAHGGQTMETVDGMELPGGGG